MNKVIVIVGPTAVGKSRFAIELAKIIKGEIISADSMQAYKAMEILSQSPTKLEKRRIPHHLVNFLKPNEEYSVAVFSKLAREKIIALCKKKKVPIVVGGSGLYVKALVDGIFPSRGKDEEIRKSLEGFAAEKGRAALHKMLEGVDPQSAEKIHPNDKKRIVRALEIYKIDKRTKTNLKGATKGIKDEYDVEIYGLAMDRKKLYLSIEKRVEWMFRAGVVKEVKRLLRRNLSITAAQALGIKEIRGYLDREYDLEKAKYLLKRNTRRFAKRQLTWFKGDRRIVWIDEIASPRFAGLAMTK